MAHLWMMTPDERMQRDRRLARRVRAQSDRIRSSTMLLAEESKVLEPTPAMWMLDQKAPELAKTTIPRGALGPVLLVHLEDDHVVFHFAADSDDRLRMVMPERRGHPFYATHIVERKKDGKFVFDVEAVAKAIVRCLEIRVEHTNEQARLRKTIERMRRAANSLPSLCKMRAYGSSHGVDISFDGLTAAEARKVAKAAEHVLGKRMVIPAGGAA